MKKKWVLWLAAALLVCLLPGMTREGSVLAPMEPTLRWTGPTPWLWHWT